MDCRVDSLRTKFFIATNTVSEINLFRVYETKDNHTGDG